MPCKRLLSAFYKTLPSKNPSKNLVFTENPYRRLLRTLLRSVRLHDPLGVRPIFAAFDQFTSHEFWASIERTPFGAILWRPPTKTGADSHLAREPVHEPHPGPRSIQRQRVDNKNKICALRGRGIGDREENRPKTLFFFFSWETPRQHFESANLFSIDFVVIAPAPIYCGVGRLLFEKQTNPGPFCFTLLTGKKQLTKKKGLLPWGLGSKLQRSEGIDFVVVVYWWGGFNLTKQLAAQSGHLMEHSSWGHVGPCRSP